jgi:hypothetical protein
MQPFNSVARLAVIAQTVVAIVWTIGIIYLIFFVPDIGPEKHRSQGFGFVDVLLVLAITITPATAAWLLFVKHKAGWWMSIAFDTLGLFGAAWMIVDDFNAYLFEPGDVRFHGLLAFMFVVPLVLLVIDHVCASYKTKHPSLELSSLI